MPNPSYKELSPFIRGQILGGLAAGATQRQLATQFGVTQSTISYTKSQSAVRLEGASLKRSGRPKKSSGRLDRIIKHQSRLNRRMPLAELKANVAPELSDSTVRRILKSSNIQKWRAAKRPALTAAGAAKHLAWARAHQNWTVEDWKRVVWSDECSVEKSGDPRTIWVFRTPQEKWNHDCIRDDNHSGRVSLMVWGCFAGSIKGPFVPIIVPKITGLVYLNILQTLLPPIMDTLRGQNIEPIFMQDNSPIHCARIVKDWLDDCGFEVMEWPPHSPDLNPIEHVWVHLKTELQKQYPTIKDTPGGVPQVKRVLSDVLPKVWDQHVLPECLEALVESMPKRVAAVIDAKGWQTRY